MSESDPFAADGQDVPAAMATPPAPSLAMPVARQEFMDDSFVAACEAFFAASAKVAIYESEVVVSNAMAGSATTSPMLAVARQEAKIAKTELERLAILRRPLNSGYWLFPVVANVTPLTFERRCIAQVVSGASKEFNV